MRKKLMLSLMAGLVLTMLTGCNTEDNKSTVFENAFKGLNEKAEMQFTCSSFDEIGTSNPNVNEVSFTYQYEPRQDMLNGKINDEDHMVYQTGGVYYTLTDAGYVKDTVTDDALRDYYLKAKSYMTYDNFKECVLEGNSEVDGIVCYRYFGTDENDYYFPTLEDYWKVEETVYVRNDTNSVYYIELRYMEDTDGQRQANFNDVYIKIKFFDETNIVVPDSIENSISRDEYEGSQTGLVDMDNLEETKVDDLREGYYLEDGTYSANKPMPTMSFEQRDASGNVIAKYDYASDIYTDFITNENIENYSKVANVIPDVTGNEGATVSYGSLPNYMNIDGVTDIGSCTLVYLRDKLKNPREDVIKDYYLASDFVYSADDGNPKWINFAEYINNKTVNEILEDARNWNNLTEEEKGILILTVDCLNGYVENIDGGNRDIKSIVLTLAGIGKTDAQIIRDNFVKETATVSE